MADETGIDPGDVQSLVTEVTRLRKQLDIADGVENNLVDANNRLLGEVERLEAALQAIADYYPWRPEPEDFSIVQRMAEDALAKGRPMPDETSTDPEVLRQRTHDAFMRVRGASCEEACEFMDVLLNPDPTRFRAALMDWARDFKARTQERSSS
jgi:hypothetical protein